ncbi:phosphate-starvation-inducible E [Tolumonas auensis DSM 9187]|jgi:protein PsiE|uniref:Protein PsiE n=1 Tax=Tolumonas auensis (strain DSM 9187 / NBRC 110442 / TA 4) TaxID=595494 RepID=C4LBG7_TOLAT|nr:phosphate-starvation-inducible PsiE family protein [Tolumonas auensis]ACQ92402.1 phosphate-starvation-inducible E [Tolumonas auensis DSM 9187]
MRPINNLIKTALEWMQDIGLVIIAIASIFAIGTEVLSMISLQKVALADLLLMFIYLEVLAMVSMYLESGKMPIRIPLYIAIVALARYLILDMKSMDAWQLVGVSASAFLMAVTVLVIRYGHLKFPYESDGKDKNS